MTIIENATCPSCNQDTMYEVKSVLGDLQYCSNCLHTQIPEDATPCPNHKLVPVKGIRSDGLPYPRLQCKNCGKPESASGIKLKECHSDFDAYKGDFYLELFWRFCENKKQFKQFVFERKYIDYLKSEAWQRKRLQCFERDNNECTECGSKTHLQAHHLTYVRLGNENLNDLQTLCRACHNAKHGKTF